MVKLIYPVGKILQEYQESHKSILARLVHSCKERTISLALCKKLARMLQDLAKCKTNGPFLATKLATMYKSCKDTCVRFFLLGMQMVATRTVNEAGTRL